MAGIEGGWRAPLWIALGLAAGCYSGADPNEFGAGDAGDDGITDDDDDDDDGDDDDDDDDSQGLCGDAQTGPTSLRRLTGEQYRRTIRDLLALDDAIVAEVVDAFPPDERIGAFKSNGVAPVGELQVEQYMDAAEALATAATTNLATLLPCDPVAMGEDACAEQFIRDIAPRAYRRPLEETQVTALVEVYNDGKAEGDFQNGVRVALQGILQSPFFLYHVEVGEGDDPASTVVVRLTDHELASRLSYFLWGSMPDDTLFAAAEAGDLGDEAGLADQVERMLDDPKAQEAIADFHLQWVGVDEMESLEKDPGTYPNFNPTLAAAMKAEAAAYANYVVSQDDARLETLLTSPVALTEDPALLAVYGATLPANHVAGTPVPLDPTQRAGLLTSAAVLAEHAHANQTSPVHRGQLVRENFLCTPLPPPPADVDNVPPDPQPGATTRERFAEHTSNPECAGCHSLIDGLGFGLEAYDGIGAYRTMDAGLPVDASGEVVGTEDIDGEFDGGVELAGLLATSDQVRTCFSKQWLRFALGRMETPDDACAVDTTNVAFEESDYDIRELIVAVATSDSFRFRRAAEGE